MRNLILILLLFLFKSVIGQSSQYSKFKNIPVDTTTAINWSGEFKYIEIVAVDNEPKTIYESGRTRLTGQELFSVTKLKSEVKQGIGTWCPPSWCFWYVLTVNKTGQVEVIEKREELRRLVTEVVNLKDAIFLQMTFATGESSGYPDPSREIVGKFKKTKRGFYLLLNREIKDCPITYADILFYVDKKGRVEIKRTKITRETDLCI